MNGASIKTTYVPAITRLIGKEDYNLVFHSWLKSYRSSWAKGTNPVRYVNKEIYYDNQKEIIKYIIENSYTIIAANPEDSDQIFGYIVCQPTVQGVGILHYCFVKQPFRKMGIGTLLLNEAKSYSGHEEGMPLVATHASGVFHSVLATKYNILYNPYIIYRELFDEIRGFETSTAYKGR